MLEIDRSFPSAYEITDFGELPGTGKITMPLFYIPQPRTRPEHEGWWLRISPSNGHPWIGVFAFGYDSPPAISRVVTTPDPQRACVISKGRAYVVKTDEPKSWDEVLAMPVLDVRVLPEHKLIVFADFTSLAAYGVSGLAWRSPSRLLKNHS